MHLLPITNVEEPQKIGSGVYVAAGRGVGSRAWPGASVSRGQHPIGGAGEKLHAAQ